MLILELTQTILMQSIAASTPAAVNFTPNLYELKQFPKFIRAENGTDLILREYPVYQLLIENTYAYYSVVSRTKMNCYEILQLGTRTNCIGKDEQNKTYFRTFLAGEMIYDTIIPENLTDCHGLFGQFRTVYFSCKTQNQTRLVTFTLGTIYVTNYSLDNYGKRMYLDGHVLQLSLTKNVVIVFSLVSDQRFQFTLSDFKLPNQSKLKDFTIIFSPQFFTGCLIALSQHQISVMQFNLVRNVWTSKDVFVLDLHNPNNPARIAQIASFLMNDLELPFAKWMVEVVVAFEQTHSKGFYLQKSKGLGWNNKSSRVFNRTLNSQITKIISNRGQLLGFLHDEGTILFYIGTPDNTLASQTYDYHIFAFSGQLASISGSDLSLTNNGVLQIMNQLRNNYTFYKEQNLRVNLSNPLVNRSAVIEFTPFSPLRTVLFIGIGVTLVFVVILYINCKRNKGEHHIYQSFVDA